MNKGKDISAILKEHEEFSEEQWDALYDLCYASGSRIGGYPNFIQFAPAFYT